MSRYWDDFEVGSTLPTRSRLITMEDHLAFCKLVGYEVPMFVDEAYAKTTPLGGVICPSHLIMSFSTSMTGDLFYESVIALMRLENAQFLGMVRPGDTIRTDVEVVEKKPTSKPDRGVIIFRDHVYNQRGEEVFRNDKIVLMRRRQPAA